MDDIAKNESLSALPASPEASEQSPEAMTETAEPVAESPESAGVPTETGSEPAAKKGGFRAWIKNHIPTKRRIIQIYTALLYNVYYKGYALGDIYKGKAKNFCVPGLNCYSCPGAIAACPLGSLQNAFASSKTGTPYYILGILLLFGVMLGRTICGFLCPVGLGQELLYKIPSPKLRKSRVTRILSYFKYVLLVALVIVVPIAYSLLSTATPAFCKFICPAGTFGGALGLLSHPSRASELAGVGGLFTWKFCLMVAIIVACVFVYRAFCRFLCPLGAIYGFFNRVSVLGIKLDGDRCTDCGKCVAHCKMDVRRVGDHECINCGECIGVCPTKAIRWKGSAIFVKDNEFHPVVTESVDLRSLAAATGDERAAQNAEASPSEAEAGRAE